MFEEKDVQWVMGIISKLELPDNFGPTYDGDTDECESLVYNQIENILSDENIFEDFYVSSGVSKLVVVFDSLPFVVKIPYNGFHTYEYGGKGECADLFCYFEYASTDEYGDQDDYCADELAKTYSVKDEGYGCFVPEMIEFFGAVCGHPIYFQEKVKPYCETTLNPSFESKEKAKSYKSFVPFNPDWIGLVIDTYGQEKWEGFISWAQDWEPEILTDMHTGNYGVRMDGTPVMFDLSGFRDSL